MVKDMNADNNPGIISLRMCLEKEINSIKMEFLLDKAD